MSNNDSERGGLFQRLRDSWFPGPVADVAEPAPARPAVPDYLQDAVLVVDPGGVVRNANSAAAVMFGTPLSRMLDTEIGRWIVGAGALDEQRPTPRRGAGGIPLGQVWALSAVRGDGETFDVEVSRGPHPGGDGLVALAVRDLYERRRSVERLQRANERLSSARQAAIDQSHAKTITLARLAQVLRTPLAGVLGYAEMLLEEVQDRPDLAELESDLARIVASGEALFTILRNVADFAEIEVGRMVVEQAPVDIRAEVERVRTFAGPIAEAGGNRLEVFVLPGVEAAWADPARVGQILRNLVLNACRFTRDGEVRVSVSRTSAEDRELVAVEIKDTGRGMSEEQLADLFVEYGQRQRDQVATGAGIGLVVSSALAELMGGSLSVDSTPGVGSTFTLTVPALTVQASALPPMMLLTPAPPRRRVGQPAVRVACGDLALQGRVSASLQRGDWSVHAFGHTSDGATRLEDDGSLLVLDMGAEFDLLGALTGGSESWRSPLLVLVPSDLSAAEHQRLSELATSVCALPEETDDLAFDKALHAAVSKVMIMGAMTGRRL